MTFRPRQQLSTGPRGGLRGAPGEGDRKPKGFRHLVMMRSVDDWPLAKILSRFLGVSSDR